MVGFYNKPVVLIVHCIDTEGPIGGNVRRNPDGSQEFMDNWQDIKNSLHDITNDHFRDENKDSFDRPYMFNWFIMDFTGFRTNPKKRIEKYNDTYDNIKSINTKIDSFHWHYHHPPESGIGDQWSDNWNSSDEYVNILGNRLIHKHDFPEAYRAGGTIEDNECSLWLEDNFLFDYSNRSSYRSEKTDNIFDFNWTEAPRHWGYYHPSGENLFSPGNMRRYIARSVDLKSRLRELQQWEVDEAFGYAKQFNKPVILSFFSHDHRDMREETRYAIELIQKSNKNYDVDFMWCDAKEAIKISENLQTRKVNINISKEEKCMITFSQEIYQKHPFIYTMDKNNKIIYHKVNLEHFGNCPYYLSRCFVSTKDIKKIGVACTSLSGDKSVKVYDYENDMYYSS